MRLADLDTPALILDRPRLDANLARMSARARALGVDLRPHLKTAKSAEIARRATAGHSGGITVSTIREAAYFAEHGFADLTLAVGITPDKLDRIAPLEAAGARVTVLTDDPGVAAALGPRAEALGLRVGVLIEIDTGDGRAGVAPESETLLEIGRAVHGHAALELRGVLTHAGHSYACRTPDEVAAVAEQERAGAVRAAERLRAAGLPAPVVSVGSTPTAVHARALDGVTEMRPGVYMFNDVFQAQIGSCAMENIALSVLAEVTGRHPERGELVIDAGGLALSKDRSTAEGPHDVGFGLVVEAEGDGALPELHVVRVSQEHGIVAAPDGGAPVGDLRPGARLRVFPNHACMTAAAYEDYHVVEDGEVVAVWPRVNGW